MCGYQKSCGFRIANNDVSYSQFPLFNCYIITTGRKIRSNRTQECIFLYPCLSNGKMFQNIHRLIDHPIPPYNKKSLCPVRTEGVKIRGTTSGSSAPRDTDLTVSSNTSRCLGRPRPPLLLLQKGHSGRYFSGFPRCLAPTGSSLAGNGSLT